VVSTFPDSRRSRGEEMALHLILEDGAEEAQTAPLLTALTSYIARAARRIAALSPGGRLDPPLTFVLDEAALICTPPLESGSAAFGVRWSGEVGSAFSDVGGGSGWGGVSGSG
jgi:hypothetical protein